MVAVEHRFVLKNMEVNYLDFQAVLDSETEHGRVQGVVDVGLSASQRRGAAWYAMVGTELPCRTYFLEKLL